MSKKHPKPEEPAGESAPMWIVSYADLVTLTMSFFVVLYALKQGGPQQQLETAAAIKAQFGYVPPVDSTEPLDMAVWGFLGKPRPPMLHNRGRSELPAQGVEGSDPEVTMIRAGKEITAGGSLTFDPASATLDPTALDALHKIADVLRGHTNIILIKGHISSDELPHPPDDSDGLSLSYRRAMAAADTLVKFGLDRRILRPMACGANEPLLTQVYSSDGLRKNRRVEIFTTNNTLSDYFPSNLVPPATRATPDSATPSTHP